MIRTQKWVIWEGQTRPKRHGILKKRPKVVSLEKEKKNVKEKKRKRRREEEEGGFKSRSSQKGMETTLSMDFVWIT